MVDAAETEATGTSSASRNVVAARVATRRRMVEPSCFDGSVSRLAQCVGLATEWGTLRWWSTGAPCLPRWCGSDLFLRCEIWTICSVEPTAAPVVTVSYTHLTLPT